MNDEHLIHEIAKLKIRDPGHASYRYSRVGVLSAEIMEEWIGHQLIANPIGSADKDPHRWAVPAEARTFRAGGSNSSALDSFGETAVGTMSEGTSR